MKKRVWHGYFHLVPFLWGRQSVGPHQWVWGVYCPLSDDDIGHVCLFILLLVVVDAFVCSQAVCISPLVDVSLASVDETNKRYLIHSLVRQRIICVGSLSICVSIHTAYVCVYVPKPSNFQTCLLIVMNNYIPYSTNNHQHFDCNQSSVYTVERILILCPFF